MGGKSFVAQMMEVITATAYVHKVSIVRSYALCLRPIRVARPDFG